MGELRYQWQIEQQVRSSSEAIDRNISTFTEDRGFLSQNVLQYLRDLVEGLIVWTHLQSHSAQFNYQTQFDPARDAAKAKATYRVLTRLHGLPQISASHYTLGGDPSKRLMLRYYEFLLRTRDLARDQLGIAILQNLELFPIDQDPSLREYYERIAEPIDAPIRQSSGKRERYYIHGTRPFFVDGRPITRCTSDLSRPGSGSAPHSDEPFRFPKLAIPIAADEQHDFEEPVQPRRVQMAFESTCLKPQQPLRHHAVLHFAGRA